MYICEYIYEYIGFILSLIKYLKTPIYYILLMKVKPQKRLNFIYSVVKRSLTNNHNMTYWRITSYNCKVMFR